MHLEQLHPGMTITKKSLQGSDQGRHSGSGSPALISDNTKPRKSSTVVPRCDLHSATLSSLSMEELQNSLQTVRHP